MTASSAIARDSPPTGVTTWLRKMALSGYDWFRGPLRARDVRALHEAITDHDSDRLKALLSPTVTLVVDAGIPDRPTKQVVKGRSDTSTALISGMAPRPGGTVRVAPVNGQPGLILARDGRDTAVISLDFAGSFATLIWIRLNPAPVKRGHRT